MTGTKTSIESWLLLGVALAISACGGTGGNDGGPSSCALSADCGAGSYCESGKCAARATAGPCAAGSGHSANDVCVGGVCLGGSCCAAACTQDAQCGATTCDLSTGACIYPAASKVCGLPESCSAGNYTAPSHCGGTGQCSQVAATHCASLACFGSQCAPSCVTSSDCDGGYCSANACLPKGVDGADCGQTATSTADESCLSKHCLTHCCTASCPSDGTACGASSCDSTGACVYPGPTTPCGPSSCVDSATVNVAPACDGLGTCQPSVGTASCAPFLCDQTAGDCFASCVADAGTCAPVSFCQAAVCAAKEAPGASCLPTSTSSADDACQSDVCLGAHCCLQSCGLDPLTHCPATCDGAGACLPQPCPGGLACAAGSTTCASSCSDNSSCDSQHFCDVTPAACCAKYNPGDVIHVDGLLGNDLLACCGKSMAPCQTLGHAMELVAAAKVSGVVISAANGDGSADWTASENWPVHLGWGVTLQAPGLYFTMPGPGIQGVSSLNHFEVYAYDPVQDTGTVTIEGGTSTPGFDNAVHVGFDSNYDHGGGLSAVADPANGGTSVPLKLSSVWLDTFPKGATGAALDVGDGATVALGPLDVVLGNPLGVGFSQGPAKVLAVQQALFCHGTGTTVTDDPSAGVVVLQMASALDADLDVESGCTVTLTQGPTIGNPLKGGLCDTIDLPTETDGIRVEGGSVVTFGSALLPGTIRCCSNAGVNLDLSDATGSPTVTLDHVNVLAVGCSGAYVGEGTLTALSSSFTQSLVGVWADANALKVDLSGGNTLTCNNLAAPVFTGCFNVGGGPTSGVDLLNTTAALSVNAENATWDQWDGTSHQTQLWNCSDNTYGNCTCSGPGCPSGATGLPDDADAVFLGTSTAPTPIDSTKGAAAIGSSCL